MGKKFEFTKQTATRTMAIVSRYMETLEDGKTYDLEIKLHRKKRSNDANSYCWVLCYELAKVIGMTKEQVYRHHIKEVGVCEFLAIPDRGVEKFKKSWESHGIGWFIELVDECKLDGCKKICCYYGSSTYDTKEMSRLIDNIVQDCKACGVETLPPEKIQWMKEEWGK